MPYSGSSMRWFTISIERSEILLNLENLVQDAAKTLDVSAFSQNVKVATQ